MSTDPFDVMFNYDDAAYTSLVDEASKDDRVGDHEFMVTDVVRDTWPSGEPRLKIKGNLVTAGNSKADWTFSPPPAPDVLEARKATMERKTKQAIASAITMAKQLAQHYSTTPAKIKVGDVFKIKTAKNKDGFIRIISFLSKDHPVGTQGNAAPPTASTVGF